MTRTEHLLWILAEECAEVAQRASKAARFGLTEVQPGQIKTNAQRLTDEMTDLSAISQMLFKEGPLPAINFVSILNKEKKIEEFLLYSKECGTLDRDQTMPDWGRIDRS
jgi:NTP pyrophosphatase (non-canonical NTP hydrolase)